jgi:vacuolar protein sorting-associated protein 52
MNDDVLLYFSSFHSGMEILKQVGYGMHTAIGFASALRIQYSQPRALLQVLTQLLLYYTRFQDIIKKTWTRPPSFSRDIVSTATILMEIKRYSRTF